MKKKTNIIWYLIAIGFITLFLLVLLSSIISIGERLRGLHLYVEIGFYILCVFLLYFLIINPVRIILFSPSLSIVTTLDKDSLKSHRVYKEVSKNVLNNDLIPLTDEERHGLMHYESYADLKDGLNVALNGSIKKAVRKIIVRNAKTVMLSTAISQNAKLDMVSVVSCNVKMIKEIVVACGFRPSMKKLSKLTINVGATALIADGLENINLEDILPTQTINSLSNIPLLKPLLSSVSQGLMNALLTIRVGLITRGYLFSDSKNLNKNQIRLEAFKDSLTILPQVIGEVLAFFPSKVVRLFGKKNDTDIEE